MHKQYLLSVKEFENRLGHGDQAKSLTLCWGEGGGGVSLNDDSRPVLYMVLAGYKCVSGLPREESRGTNTPSDVPGGATPTTEVVRLLLLRGYHPRAAHHDILALHRLGKGNDVADRVCVRKDSHQTVESQREPRVRRTPRAQRLEEVRELADALVRHLENLSHDILLHLGHVDAPAAAAELDAIDDQVVVVGLGLERVRGEQLDVVGREWRGERVVGRREARLAALPGVRVVVEREHGKVGDPEEPEAKVAGQETAGDGLVVDVVSGGSQGGGAAREWHVLSGLEKENIAIFQVLEVGDAAVSAGQPLDALVSQGRETTEGSCRVVDQGRRRSIDISGEWSGEVLHEGVDEFRDGLDVPILAKLGAKPKGLDGGVLEMGDLGDKLGRQDVVDSADLAC